jgi:hypothetical protein
VTKRLTQQEFLEEFEWTRCRHGGLISVASTIFNSKPAAIARRLERLRAKGVQVDFTDDSKRVKR